MPMLHDDSGRPITRSNPVPAAPPAEWTVTGTSDPNTAKTITWAAEAGKRHIITGYLVVLRAAASGADVSVALKDGATTKVQDYIGNAAPRGTRVGATGLKIAMSTDTAANLVVGAAGALAIVELTMWGYTETV